MTMWRNWTKLSTRNFRISVRNLSQGSTVDPSELRHFKQLTDDWWNETGVLKPLHALNKLRIPLIRDGILNILSKKADKLPLQDVSILDIGCGGGILTEPLSKLGGIITGIDANCDLIGKAKLHANTKNLKVEYICSCIEEYVCNNKEKHDAVIASEILEHVTQKKEFVEACIQCLKPGGSVFITTINKTFVANLLGVVAAENILGLVPKGTHQFEKFIEPHRLEKMLEDLNCKTILSQGMFYNFVTNEWSWCSNDSINYAIHAVKLK